MNKVSRKADSIAVLGRVLRFMLHYYKIPFAIVILCILATAVATVVGATFPQTLVDDYIVPMLQSGSNDFSGLAKDLFRLGCIMAAGAVTAFTYNRIMVTVSQGTMRRLRDTLFGRSKSTLQPVEKAPFFAIPLFAGGSNTKGGLATTADREVLDWSGKAIPGLYAVGEIACGLNRGGAMLTDALVFGIVCGKKMTQA